MDENMKNCLLFLMSPIAFLLLILMALCGLLRFLYKATLLFIIVAIHTPFAVMFNISILMFQYNLSRFQDSDSWTYSDPRASLGIEVQLIISDFIKVVAGELLLVMSAGVITFYTAPKLVFYISTTVGVIAILHKWLNTSSLSKTALSCLCDGYGLSAVTFLFSFMGLFEIGCHPVAKCAFAAKRAFLFVKDGTSPEEGNRIDQNNNTSEGSFKSFSGATIDPHNSIVNFQWNAFERGLFKLTPRINFITRDTGKCILKSFMVLVFLKMKLCDYPVERLELPEDYSKINELYNFLVTLSSKDGFVTDKMRGRYELSLTLSEIVDGVANNVGYRIMKPLDNVFVVALSTKKP